jgi:uncharacterized membrane protein
MDDILIIKHHSIDFYKVFTLCAILFFSIAIYLHENVENEKKLSNDKNNIEEETYTKIKSYVSIVLFVISAMILIIVFFKWYFKKSRAQEVSAFAGKKIKKKRKRKQKRK